LNFLKGLGTYILSFLLFLSLTVFSLAFLLHNTVLSPEFVTKQVDRIDVSDLAHDLAEDMISEDLPAEAQFLQNAVFDVIDDQEPWLKEQLHYVIDTAYDFLLGKSDKLEIAIYLDDLKKGLRESLWESLNEQVTTWLPDIIRNELGSYVEEHIDEYVQQIPDEYVPGGVTGLPKEQLMQLLDVYLLDVEEQITQEGRIPQISGLLEVLIKPYYDDYFDEFLEIVPSEIVYDEDTISADVMDQLLTARKYIGYFQAAYYGLIAFMVVLAAGIFLINWNVKVAARALGIDLIVFGVLDLAGVIAAKLYSPVGMLPEGASSIEPVLTALYSDVLSIMQWFSIGILIVGVVLLVVSFVVKSKSSEEIQDS
jgi:hypothetical protein